jgi:hypothetical protein
MTIPQGPTLPRKPYSHSLEALYRRRPILVSRGDLHPYTVQEIALMTHLHRQEPRLTAAVHIRLKSRKEEQTINNFPKAQESLFGAY